CKIRSDPRSPDSPPWLRRGGCAMKSMSRSLQSGADGAVRPNIVDSAGNAYVTGKLETGGSTGLDVYVANVQTPLLNSACAFAICPAKPACSIIHVAHE